MPRTRTKTYQTTWRNKDLTTDATTIGEMAASLEAAAKQLREMEAAGVRLEDDGAMVDDYATLTTNDPAIARRFGFDAV